MAVEEPQMEQYMDVVRRVARALARRLQVEAIDIEEFEADGFEGLVKALHDYDGAKGPVVPYIILRSRGAMIDGLRRQALLTRRDRAAGISEPPMISLEQELADGVRLVDAIPDPTAQTAEVAIARAASTPVPSEVAALPKRYQRILLARFLQQRRRKDVAVDEGVSPGRLSQIEASIRGRLRAAAEGVDAVGEPELQAKELTTRELRVLELAAEGASAVETARKLHKSLETVKSQRRTIIAKLRAKNMTNAVAISFERGLLH